MKGKVLLMLVNEPSSDDPKFFNGQALTYYGRWTYKYEEAARKGAVGVILIHKTDMASYPWEVVRNSNSGEKEFLKVDESAIESSRLDPMEVARQLAARSAGIEHRQIMMRVGLTQFSSRCLFGQNSGLTWLARSGHFSRQYRGDAAGIRC